MGPAKLQFPCHLYFLGPNKLSKYSLVSKKSGCFVQPPTTNRAGQPHQAKRLVHSPQQHAWLVFFQTQSGASTRSVGGTENGRAAAAAGKETDSEGWSYTLITDTAGSDKASWYLPGTELCCAGLAGPALSSASTLHHLLLVSLLQQLYQSTKALQERAADSCSTSGCGVNCQSYWLTEQMFTRLLSVSQLYGTVLAERPINEPEPALDRTQSRATQAASCHPSVSPVWHAFT